MHLLTDGEEIPFDLKDVRTVFFALDDPDRLEEAQRELGEKVAALEGSVEDRSNPVAAVRDLRLLQASDSPETREIGQVLAAVSDIRDEVRGLAAAQAGVTVGTWQGRETGARGTGTGNASRNVERRIEHLVGQTLTTSDIAKLLELPVPLVEQAITRLEKRSALFPEKTAYGAQSRSDRFQRRQPGAPRYQTSSAGTPATEIQSPRPAMVRQGSPTFEPCKVNTGTTSNLAAISHGLAMRSLH